ncbi:MAG: glycoside hydrolase family 125 protein [archaeon]|nr:glycoside hydrolase family 125 protein [archaeon]
MIKSPFRPSDDATRLPFFIPGNAFAVVELRRTAALLSSVLNQTALSKDLGSLADEIDAAIQRYGVVADPDDPSRKIYAFEVDGYGGQYLIDDANVPSLLALPFLGYLDASDPIYQNTRARILGPRNPYWFKGAAGQGIGSPHTGLNNIWPMSIVFQALTSDDPTEIASCLRLLKTSSAGLGFMHESYDKEDPRVFTRSWFAMANSLFGALILRTLQLYPSVLTNLPL